MDETDVAIMTILQANARASIKEISGHVSLSVPAVSSRLRKLEDAGVIKGYTAIFDEEKFDKDFCCFCTLLLDDHNLRSDSFFSYITSSSDILECHRVTGTHEYLLKIRTKSPKNLEHILAEMRERWGVVQSITYTVLSTMKERASVAPELPTWLK